MERNPCFILELYNSNSPVKECEMCLTIGACKLSYPLPPKEEGILNDIKSNCLSFTPKLLRSINVDLLYLQSFPLKKSSSCIYNFHTTS